MITEELKAHLIAAGATQRVEDVRIGLGYTAVMLEDGNLGVAYTFHDNAAAGCSVFTGTRPLAGRRAAELLEYLGSSEGVESTVGLATANALANRWGPDQEQGDILDVLQLRPDDRVGMVGYFGPLVSPVEKRVRELTIFERNAARSERVRPAKEALTHLPQCEVAIITSTAVMLGDLDDLLDAAAGCREVALVGASTPLVPEIFAQRGVTLLSGITVTDTSGILQIVSEGGGMGFFGGHIRKVNIRV